MKKRRIVICFLVMALFITFIPKLSAQEAEKININAATAPQLQQLKGIGKTIADRIVQYREEHGPFKTVEEITKVSGIGAKKYEAIKDRIMIEELE